MSARSPGTLTALQDSVVHLNICPRPSGECCARGALTSKLREIKPHGRACLVGNRPICRTVFQQVTDCLLTLTVFAPPGIQNMLRSYSASSKPQARYWNRMQLQMLRKRRGSLSENDLSSQSLVCESSMRNVSILKIGLWIIHHLKKTRWQFRAGYYAPFCLSMINIFLLKRRKQDCFYEISVKTWMLQYCAVLHVVYSVIFMEIAKIRVSFYFFWSQFGVL